MVRALFGKKIGMTQVFDKTGKVVPVTVINIARWLITQIKTDEKDGYRSFQLGLLKNKCEEKEFSSQWLKKRKNYFTLFREVPVEKQDGFSVGQKLTIEDVSLKEGDTVVVTGKSKGAGFQGVVKRWNFKGGPASHGSTFHRAPGSIGNMCSQGNVIKGKKLPGHKGNVCVSVKGLEIIRIDKDAQCLFVKGAVPGKKNTIVEISKQEA